MTASTHTPLAYWSKSEAQKRIREAAALARSYSRVGIPAKAKVEVGERTEPQYVTGPAGTVVTQADLWEADLQEFVLPRDLRIIPLRNGGTYTPQPFGVGYVCHLYFTGGGQWGELLDVVTVWLGDNLNGPQVIA